MKIPQVVIIGRPNVGKSSVFNWLAGKRLAIVDNVAGVTRDRITHLIEVDDRMVEIVDTGGVGVNDVDNLSDEIEEQIAAALESASIVLFVVDARAGLALLDEEVAKRLRRVPCPIICVANKADAAGMDGLADEFYRMGHGELLRVSAHQNRHKQELLQAIASRLPPPEEGDSETEEAVMKLAIVGRRNVGKSTFVNSLAHAERMIVSEVPGTTRDSVDVQFEMDGKTFIAIDTPGLRRRKSVRKDIDYYGVHRAQRSIRRADVVLMFFDAAQRISRVDKQLGSYIAENYKPCVLVVNKWDLMAGQLPTEEWSTYLRDTFPSLWHTPIAFITAMTGKNVKTLVNHAQMLYKQSKERVTTGELNRLVARAVEHHPPPIHRGRRPKIFYAAQIGEQPPTIAMVCSNPEAFSNQYRRYLLSVLRDQLALGEVPIRLFLQERTRGNTPKDKDETPDFREVF